VPEYHNIALKSATAERLAESKRLGESWDDVVRRQAFGGDTAEDNA